MNDIILDNDLYKFTMQQAVMQMYPSVKVKYKYINRVFDESRCFDDKFMNYINSRIYEMRNLRIDKQHKEWLLESCPFLTPAYIDFLAGYRYDPDEIKINPVFDTITIEGYWYRTILWEVPLLAMISEYFKSFSNNYNKDNELILKDDVIEKEIINKYDVIKNEHAKFADFGTRRRYSFGYQYKVVQTLANKPNFIGTSNVLLAYLNKVRPIGTQAHEWFMFHGAKYGYKNANSVALGKWVDVYHGDLGIALTDTYGTDNFYENFDMLYAKLFDGVRHDSGDPIKFIIKTAEHYKSLGINPSSKIIVFSDGIKFDKKLIHDIIKACNEERVKFTFGIGTALTNPDDCDVNTNIVIKLSEVLINDKWVNCVKLSDDEGKHTGFCEEVNLCKKVLNV